MYIIYILYIYVIYNLLCECSYVLNRTLSGVSIINDMYLLQFYQPFILNYERNQTTGQDKKNVISHYLYSESEQRNCVCVGGGRGGGGGSGRNHLVLYYMISYRHITLISYTRWSDVKLSANLHIPSPNI